MPKKQWGGAHTWHGLRSLGFTTTTQADYKLHGIKALGPAGPRAPSREKRFTRSSFPQSRHADCQLHDIRALGPFWERRVNRDPHYKMVLEPTDYGTEVPLISALLRGDFQNSPKVKIAMPSPLKKASPTMNSKSSSSAHSGERAQQLQKLSLLEKTVEEERRQRIMTEKVLKVVLERKRAVINILAEHP